MKTDYLISARARHVYAIILVSLGLFQGSRPEYSLAIVDRLLVVFLFIAVLRKSSAKFAVGNLWLLLSSFATIASCLMVSFLVNRDRGFICILPPVQYATYITCGTIALLWASRDVDVNNHDDS
jgi:hypothetical protein